MKAGRDRAGVLSTQGEQEECYLSGWGHGADSGCRSREVCRAAGCVGSPVGSVLLCESVNPFSNSYSIALTSFSILKDQCKHSVFYFTLI